MEKVKDLVELLIASTEEAKKDCKCNSMMDFFDGKLSAFKLVKDYIDRQVEIEKRK